MRYRWLAREPNSSDASVFTEIRRSALEPAFVRSAFLRVQRFCERKNFRTRLATHEFTLRISICSVECRGVRAAVDRESARQSSRTRYAVRLRCVRPDRPPALNADYSGSNGSGRDRIGLPPGMSLIGNYRIEGPIFGDRGRTQRRCPMDIFLDVELEVCRGMSSELGIFIRIAFIRYFDYPIFYTVI